MNYVQPLTVIKLNLLLQPLIQLNTIRLLAKFKKAKGQIYSFSFMQKAPAAMAAGVC